MLRLRAGAGLVPDERGDGVMQVKVLSAKVLLTHATDEVYLETALPSPFPPEVDSTPLTLRFAVQANHGVEYVRQWFCMEPEVINARRA